MTCRDRINYDKAQYYVSAHYHVFAYPQTYYIFNITTLASPNSKYLLFLKFGIKIYFFESK
jgi:hypothetical protein